MSSLRGTWYISPTPFTEQGAVDVESLTRLVAAAARWGADGITILGVMGEAADLTGAERDLVLTTVAGAARDVIAFAVGCSAPSAAVVRENARRAVAAGASAVMVSAPPLLKDTDTIGAFYRAAAAGLDVPVIVQDEPAATGVTMPVSGLLAALDACGADTVKLEDPPTPPKISKLLDQRPGLTVFGGLGGVSAYHELKRGGAGTMTGFAFPEILRAIRLAAESGDWAEAARINDTYLPYIAFEGQPKTGLAIRKEVLRRRGVLSTARTRALSPLPDQRTLDDLDDVLARVGLVPAPEALAL
ncbi:dihydrodipicolinate synthase family protein [Actinoplanes sp. N902-109]|uniref:dihydrodipicolinate synthase family protein n=1 Tax=Actinoplanes sp. (strain N902-109) TaxID=649831 RepID=UPI0003293C6A|nr:dihydrodipicolinate synthase family protein [Actinoplanes sp. N902-109]AGL16248.1 dihydrodipicolinate synthetase [Actinoplanes sp. N902-109]